MTWLHPGMRGRSLEETPFRNNSTWNQLILVTSPIVAIFAWLAAVPLGETVYPDLVLAPMTLSFIRFRRSSSSVFAVDSSPRLMDASRSLQPWMAGCLVCSLAGLLALSIDAPLARWLSQTKLPGDLRKALDLAEVFAHGYGVLAITACVWVLSPMRRGGILRLLCCTFGAGLAADVVKACVLRLRPKSFDLNDSVLESFVGFLTAVVPDGYSGFLDHRIHSFPSGHTATAVGLAVGLCYLFPRGRVLFVAFAVLASAQRLAGLHHYSSDVFAGAALALLFAGCCVDERFLGRWFTRVERALSGAPVSCS